MSATERLRGMLDVRGVEYEEFDGAHARITCWTYMGELTAMFAEYENGTTRFELDHWCFDPEQAITATLGAETCHAVMMDGFGKTLPTTREEVGA